MLALSLYSTPPPTTTTLTPLLEFYNLLEQAQLEK